VSHFSSGVYNCWKACPLTPALSPDEGEGEKRGTPIRPGSSQFLDSSPPALSSTEEEREKKLRGEGGSN
jgi:hypothetical protein